MEGLHLLIISQPESYEPPTGHPGRTWGQFLQSLVLLLSCMASLGVAAVGFFLLVYIFFSRSANPDLHKVGIRAYAREIASSKSKADPNFETFDSECHSQSCQQHSGPMRSGSPHSCSLQVLCPASSTPGEGPVL